MVTKLQKIQILFTLHLLLYSSVTGGLNSMRLIAYIGLR